MRSILTAVCVTAAALTLAAPARSVSEISATITNGAVCAANPAAKCFGLGDSVNAELRYTFTDIDSFGGGFLLNLDPTLVSVASFTLDPSWGFDPGNPSTSFSRPLGFFAVDPSLLAIGDDSPFGGSAVIGTLVLNAIGAGDGAVTPAQASNDVGQNPAGPILDENGSPLAVSFSGAAFSIVPEPGTALLLAGGVTALGARGRRRR